MNRKSLVFSCLFFLTLAVALAVPPKNVIIMIGDGMGFEQVKAARYYASGNAVPLSFETLPYSGAMMTRSANSSVTDSAAGGTAIATGVKVNNDVVSVAIPGNGAPLLTLLEHFKAAGKSTGTVTTTYHEHATPAAFSAHNSNRNNYAAIGVDIMTNSKPNVLLGGSATISTAAAAAAGYTTVTNRAQMLAVNTASVTHLFSQFGTGYMPYEYDGSGMGTTYPRLTEMTQTALDILEKNPDGFFLMVEGGRIDHAGHDNNLPRNIYETIEFANATQLVMDWAAGRTDTLIIVTADHETGGLTVTGTPQQGVFPSVTWSTGNHTGVNVPVFARGVNAERVKDTIDNTDIFYICTADLSNGNSYVAEPVLDDFNSYASGTVLANAPNWYSATSGSFLSPSVQAGIGVGGTPGVTNNTAVVTMSGGEMREKNRVAWQELEDGTSLTLRMDFQASSGATFDDDRLCLTVGHSTVDSFNNFGVQLEANPNRIEAYYQNASGGNVRTHIGTTGFSLTANAWYTLELVITKLGASQARFDTSLTRMSDSVVLTSGTYDTAAAPPHARYLNDDMWPAFKNHLSTAGGTAAVDNFYFSGVPRPEPIGLTSSVVLEDFESYADELNLSNASNWFSTTSAPAVGATVGVGGSQGVGSGSAVAVMSGGAMLEANRIRWQDLAVGNYVTLSMDFQTSTGGLFDDDRLCLSSNPSSVSSDQNFGVQLKANPNRIESYYRSTTDARIETPIVSGLSLTASTWYTLNLQITKLGDSRARFDTSLTTLDGTLVGEYGTYDTIVEQPHERYFNDANGGLWPAFKNHTTNPGPADNFYFAAGPVPTDPYVAPFNEAAGTVGDIVFSGGEWKVQGVTLAYTAAGDPDALRVPQLAVHPDVVKHNIYLQIGAPEDPALHLYATVPASGNPTVVYGPLATGALKPATTYLWQVEDVINNASGGTAGDPNNIVGPIWSFTTVSDHPMILSISDHQLADAGAAELTVEADELADNYRWFKVVGVQDTAGGESDDIKLTDGGLYSGTTTDTLTITGMSPNGSDDARYYAVAYNGNPEGSGLGTPSEERWVWYPRQVSHYMFDMLSYFTEGDNAFIKDMISGYDAQLMSGNGSAVPYLTADAPAGLAAAGRVTSLPFNAGNQIYLQVEEQFAATFKDLTISMWFKTTATSSYQRLFDYGTGQGNSTFISPHYNGEGRAAFAVDVPDHGERRVESALGLVQNNTWTHITATLSGNTARLFINGEWVNLSNDFPYPPVDNGATTQNWIGRSQYGSDPYFSGNIADLKVWNYALTNEEVAQEYLNAAPSENYICDREEFRHFQSMDSNDNCIIEIEDIAELAVMWMEDYLIFAD